MSLREHACVSSRGAQSTELVWILDFKQILLLFIIISLSESKLCTVDLIVVCKCSSVFLQSIVMSYVDCGDE